MSMFETGTAAHSKYHPDPLFHLIVSDWYLGRHVPRRIEEGR